MIKAHSKCPRGIPITTFEVLQDYVLEHRNPGGFLTAVLSNDLLDAVTRADSENIRALPELVKYIYWNCPKKCWGDADSVEEWLEERSSSYQGLHIAQ